MIRILRYSLIILFSFTFLSQGQAKEKKKSLKRFYKENKIKGESHLLGVPVWLTHGPASLVSLFVNRKNNPELKLGIKVLKQVNSVRIMNVERNSDVLYNTELIRGFKYWAVSQNYLDLLTVNSADSFVKVSIKYNKRKSKIKRLMVVVFEDNSFTAVHIKGGIKPKQLKRLIRYIIDKEEMNLMPNRNEKVLVKHN
ncbi:DUF4252 domain-containing protein [Xanthovirga aplysinae]|uniref:DUF4252 domain-containing protein n=1 Tax=Xanthovirga aplysinae TaxID=2529853 RepID=UPI0012BB5B8B|nr:DUF4252 domain-containing protein [Xanthovirga aplysinae]MTI32705.1 DUF4252 domain-containing protein [Xanthovirga aplysinae]